MKTNCKTEYSEEMRGCE